MKKLIISCLLLALPYTLTAEWEILNQGMSIWGIHFVNDQTGWISGSDGQILKTTNGGTSWELIKTDKQWYISKIFFVNESVGWAIGSNQGGAIIIKSIDGGLSWTLQQEMTDIYLNDISPADEKNVYVISPEKLFKSSDGGTSWDSIGRPASMTRFLTAVWFSSADTGTVLGNYYDGIAQIGLILRTTDGGKNWDEKTVKEFNYMSDMVIVNDTTAFFRVFGDTTQYLCITEDRFSTWTIKSRSRYWMASYQFLDKNTGYALRSDSLNSMNIMKTTDGGVNWTKIPSPEIGSRLSFFKLHFFKTGKGFLIGNFGCLFKTDDEVSWELLKTGYPFKGAAFFDKRKGILYGGFHAGIHEMFPSGDMFLTNDGGETFTHFFDAPDLFKSCRFINDSIGFASGKSIYKTTDGGKNWGKKYTGGYEPSFGPDLNTINDLSISAGAGWAVGRDYDSTEKIGKAIILNSSDTGDHWSMVWQKKDSENSLNYLSSICTSGNTYWAVGFPGLIVKYTNLMGWKTINSGTSLPLLKVFSVGTNVWISGGYAPDQSIFLKSTDNGITWKQNSKLPVISDIYFKNASIGWAVGYDKDYSGIILRSTNGGDEWQVILDKLPGMLNSIIVQDNYAWVMGDNGMIIRTTDLGLTWMDGKIKSISYKLEQNYPNPFNPSTFIKMQVPEAGRVKLTVYDILGKEVTVLVNEDVKPGVHHIEFNGSNLPSGIYFCRLETDSYTSSIKMLLLK